MCLRCTLQLTWQISRQHPPRTLINEEFAYWLVWKFLQSLLLLLLQSALKPLVGFGQLNYCWVFSAGRFLQSAVASSTSNPQPGGPVIRTFQLPPCPPRLKLRERTPAAEGGTMGEKLPRILPKVATSTSLLGSFTCRKFTTWDRRLQPFLSPQTRAPEDSTLTSRPPKPAIRLGNSLSLDTIWMISLRTAKAGSIWVSNRSTGKQDSLLESFQ